MSYNWKSVIGYYEKLRKEVPSGEEYREAILAGYDNYLEYLKEQQREEQNE